MDKLKIYSAYLPFEVKINYNSIDCIGILKSIDTFRNQVSFFSKHLFEQIEIEDVKPILFSLEDLTKEITIGGKEIIAIDYIATSIQNRQRILRRVSNNLNLDVLEYWQFERLLELKFNVFNLPETEYIKVTDEFNPYK